MMPQPAAPAWHGLLEVLRGWRSRRFGLGMRLEAGPMAYASRRAGLTLTEEHLRRWHGDG
jgi:hypothetical protein